MTTRPWNGRMLRLIIVAVAIAVAVALLLRLLAPGGESGETGAEKLRASPIRVVVENGETRLIVPSAALRSSGIALAGLTATTVEPGIPAFATALQAQPLLEQRRALLAAAAESARARAAAAAADVQAGRLRTLNGDNAIVSRRELDAGQVAAASERAGVLAANSQLALLEATAARQWGVVIARWLITGSAQLDGLTDGRTLLLQIAPTRDLGSMDPAGVSLLLPQGGRLGVRVISASPQADAQFQTRTFFALTPANLRILPGMTIPASFPTGPAIVGVDIPSGAVIRWKGGSYVYVAAGNSRLVRRAISTNLPSPSGWVDATFKPGTQIVVAGAQLLLSEEIRGAAGGSASDD